MSSYFSRIKRVYALGLDSSALDLSPAFVDFGISGNGGTKLLSIDHQDFNPQSNVIIRSIELINNFADGLVKKNADQLFAMLIVAKAFSYNTLPAKKLTGNSYTVNGALKTISGNATNFDVCVTAGDYVFAGGYIHKVVTVDSAIQLTVRDVVPFSATVNISNLPGFILKTDGTDQTRILLLSELYTQYPTMEFLSPALISSVDTIALGIEVTIQPNNPPTSTPIAFMTSSINPAYDGALCFTNAAVEIEYTPRSA
jgi:hypothetical protein